MNTLSAWEKVITPRLLAVNTAINEASRLAGRGAQEVSLLAVSKHQPSEAVLAAAAAGQRAFGENYVQEGVSKICICRAAGDQEQGHGALVWHLIGPLQSNKTRLAAEHFDWVESVDSLKIAERLSAQRPTHLPPLQVCVQVNISGEASKSGCLPDEASALCSAVAQLPRLQLRGLMAIPEPVSDTDEQRRICRSLYQRFTQIRSLLGTAVVFDTLSLGMSHDFRAAIAEGATQVRIGTALFGERLGPA